MEPAVACDSGDPITAETNGSTTKRFIDVSSPQMATGPGERAD
jgi:hypothetical protein